MRNSDGKPFPTARQEASLSALTTGVIYCDNHTVQNPIISAHNLPLIIITKTRRPVPNNLGSRALPVQSSE